MPGLGVGEHAIDQRIDVSLPARFDRIDNPALIVCLDGPWVFGTVASACRVMSFSGEAPEAVVAGLSFVTDTNSEYTNVRARWFTPTPFIPPKVTGVKTTDPAYTGHADELINFVADKLMPELEQRYGPGERWFVGHSFSALFGLNLLFKQPSLFDRWLFASTSIWWDQRAILKHEADYAAVNDDLAADVFLCAGADEVVADDEGNQYDMVANVNTLATTLRARSYPSLRLTHATLPNETHSSSIGSAVSAGLRSLFDND